MVGWIRRFRVSLALFLLRGAPVVVLKKSRWIEAINDIHYATRLNRPLMTEHALTRRSLAHTRLTHALQCINGESVVTHARDLQED